MSIQILKSSFSYQFCIVSEGKEALWQYYDAESSTLVVCQLEVGIWEMF